MVCTIRLISILLVTISVTLAVPSTFRRQVCPDRRREIQLLARHNPDFPNSLIPKDFPENTEGGAVLDYPPGSFTSVTGTFTVPEIYDLSGFVNIWVGIAGVGEGILTAGVATTLSGSTYTYRAWYQWYPDNSSDFSDLAISTNDVITVTVSTSSTAVGQAVIENVTTGQTTTKSLTSTAALSDGRAEWMVEDGMCNIITFGTINITNAIATTFSGSTTGPSGSTLSLVGAPQFNVTTGNDSVAITYVGPTGGGVF